MRKFISNLGNILPLSKDSNVPAMILAISLFSFYIFSDFQMATLKTINILFYIVAFSIYAILIYYNNTKPSMFSLIIILSYVGINFLKKKYGEEYLHSPYYINICILVPLNLIFFYFIPQKKFFKKENAYILIGIFMQIAIIENLSNNHSEMGYNIFFNSTGINSLSFLIFICGAIVLLVNASISGRILDIFLMFAFIQIMFGFIYSSNTTAFGIFFTNAIITILFGICYDTYYLTYKDIATNLSSRNSYIINSKELPLKYSIGIIKIDDFERLKTIFKKREITDLIKMISIKITEKNSISDIYKYSEDEFVIIFNNKDTKESFDELDNMRRRVAASEFLLKRRKKPIKITVSGSITTKKRSDANSFEVLARAKKTLDKANKFTQNITSKA